MATPSSWCRQLQAPRTRPPAAGRLPLALQQSSAGQGHNAPPGPDDDFVDEPLHNFSSIWFDLRIVIDCLMDCFDCFFGWLSSRLIFESMDCYWLDGFVLRAGGVPWMSWTSLPRSCHFCLANISSLSCHICTIIAGCLGLGKCFWKPIHLDWFSTHHDTLWLCMATTISISTGKWVADRGFGSHVVKIEDHIQHIQFIDEMILSSINPTEF